MILAAPMLLLQRQFEARNGLLQSLLSTIRSLVSTVNVLKTLFYSIERRLQAGVC